MQLSAAKNLLGSGNALHVLTGTAEHPMFVKDLTNGMHYMPGQFGMDLKQQQDFLGTHLAAKRFATMSTPQLRKEAIQVSHKMVAAVEAGHAGRAEQLSNRAQALTMLAAFRGDMHSATGAVEELTTMREILKSGQLTGSGGAWNPAYMATRLIAQ